MAAVRRLRPGAALGAALALTGCGGGSINPVAWWHGLQGGAIAEQRPPPPGIDMPYPNLGSVPPKPKMPDPAARQRLTQRLLADRANAQYEVTLMPIPKPTGAAPKAGQPAPDPNAASASLEAATAPPRRAVPTPSLLGPADTGPAGLPPSAPLANGPLPNIPAAPPPPPKLAGVAIPVTRPTPFPVAPPEAPKAEKLGAAAGTPVAIGFRPNSAVLSSDDVAVLKGLAARRGAHKVAVIGFGDTTDATPQVQAEGVDLALARARAIAAALNAQGVPPEAIRMTAEAAGRGGAARLID